MLAVSEADPYVILQLPTAPGTKFRTKTVTNSSHPIWNESFSFLIQSQVKVKARVPPAAHPRTGRTLHREGSWRVPSPRAQSEKGMGRRVSPCPSLDVLCWREGVNLSSGCGPDVQQAAGPLQAHLCNGDSKNPLLIGWL